MRFVSLAFAALCAALFASPAAYGQAPAKPANETLITLGTAGGPPPRPGRAGISTLLQVNGKSYLFDAGDGFTRRLAAANIPLGDIQKIFLTHLHDDHYAGLAAFVGQLWTFNPKNKIDVYGPALTKKVVEDTVNFQSINGAIRSVERKIIMPRDIFISHEIGPGEVYKDENIKVTAIENTHFNFSKGSVAAGDTISLSYRIETPSRVIVITGDTGAFPGLAKFASNADLFVSEVIDADEVLTFLTARMPTPLTKEAYAARKAHMEDEHMTPESVAKIATEAKIKKVVLTHFQPRRSGDLTFEDFAKRTRAGFSGEVIAAKDLDKF